MATSTLHQLAEPEVNESERLVIDLIAALDGIPESMDIFAKGMRQLFAEKSMSTESEMSSAFNLIRDKMIAKAQIYVDVLLPSFTQFVESLDDFFDLYLDNNYEEWLEGLGNVIQDLKQCRQRAEDIQSTHTGIKKSLIYIKHEIETILQQRASTSGGSVGELVEPGSKTMTVYSQLLSLATFGLLIGANFWILRFSQMCIKHINIFSFASLLGLIQWRPLTDYFGSFIRGEIKQETEAILLKKTDSCTGYSGKWDEFIPPKMAAPAHFLSLPACGLLIGVNFWVLKFAQIVMNRTNIFSLGSFLGLVQWRFLSHYLRLSTKREMGSNEPSLVQNNALQDIRQLVFEQMIPALSCYMDCVGKSTYFFSKLEENLVQLTQVKQECMEYKMRSHYAVFTKSATAVKRKCNQYVAIIPDIKSDIIAISERRKQLTNEISPESHVQNEWRLTSDGLR